jgi:hypothetical protein
MRVLSQAEAAHTRRKLLELETAYQAASTDPVENKRARELTLASLAKLIKQLKEEILLHEAHQSRSNAPIAR